MRVVGLSVAAPFPGVTRPGTELLLGLEADDRYFLGVTPEKSKLEFLRDDTGRSIAPEDWLDGEKEQPYEISSDRKKILLRVFSPLTPTKSATRVSAKGSVRVIYGVNMKTTQSEPVNLTRLWTRISVGPLEASVSSVAYMTSGEDKWVQISLQSDKSWEAIRDVSFLDSKGDPIPLRKVSSSTTYGSPDDLTYVKSFQLIGSVSVASVKISYFEKEIEADLPFFVRNIGMGLGPAPVRARPASSSGRSDRSKP